MDTKKRMKNGVCDDNDATMPKQSKILESLLPMAFKISKDQRVFKKRGRYVDPVADSAVESLFNKKFELEGKFTMPKVDTMFTESGWKVEDLQSLKRELNETKSKLNDYNISEWNYHTRRRNKASEVLRRLRDDLKVEYLTQAWCKFYENACSFPLINEEAIKMGKFRSLHLCEAPGAFVASLNHWLKSKAPKIDWNWLGTTLNPHYEGHSLTNMVRVDGLINVTAKNWFYGADNTGNLMNLKNLDALVARTKSDFVNLVTADGSTDCLDTPAEQEQVVSQLHYCETVAALHVLGEGGNFLLKIFTIFEHQTVCLIYLLSCFFERIIFNKPVNSREGNSEMYVVCLGFAGSEKIAPYAEILRRNYEILSSNSMFRRDDIPDNFLRQIIDCGEFFKAHQCEAIFANIRTFRGGYDPSYVDPDIEKIKRLVAERFIKTCELRPLASDDMKILGGENIEKQCSKILDFPTPPSSYNSRRKRRDLDPKERLSIYAYELDFASVPNNGDKFELNVIPDELVISTGKPYEKIESTKFCAVQILQMYNESLMLGNEIGFSGRIPLPENINEFTEENSSVDKILSFEYTSEPDNNKLISKVCDTLANIEKNQTLVLLGYSMLSQLSVGLLYFLARTFDSVEIEASEKLGCIITLRGYNEIGEIEKIFQDIENASREAKQNGEVVLSILPITTLCDSSRYRDIGKMNHGIMRHCVQQIVASSKECYESYAHAKKKDAL